MACLFDTSFDVYQDNSRQRECKQRLFPASLGSRQIAELSHWVLLQVLPKPQNKEATPELRLTMAPGLY